MKNDDSRFESKRAEIHWDQYINVEGRQFL